MQSEIAAIDNCDWIDNKAGLCKSELMDMLGVEEKISVIDPTSMAAFNFKKYGAKDDLTVNRNPVKGEDTSTINSKDQEGKSLAEHTQYEFDQGDQTTLGGSERGGPDDATEAEGALPWESDWTIDKTVSEMPESNMRRTRVMGEDDDEDIDMNKNEGLNYRTARYDNRQEEEEETSYANSKTNVSHSSANSSTDNPSVQQLMDQMAVIQRQLAQLKAQSPPKSPVHQDKEHASPSMNTPAEQENNEEINMTNNKEAKADSASEQPPPTQGKTAEVPEDSKEKSKSKGKVASGHQNG